MGRRSVVEVEVRKERGRSRMLWLRGGVMIDFWI